MTSQGTTKYVAKRCGVSFSIDIDAKRTVDEPESARKGLVLSKR